jgi:hypothetical protein
VAVVLAAHRQLLELQRQELQLQELQGAQLCSLLYNINRDSKKGKATSHQDWLFFRHDDHNEEDQLPAVVAHICLALRHEQQLPPLLIGIWRDVVKRSAVAAELPEIRALVSADRNLVVVAPSWEGGHVRGFIAAKGQTPGSTVELSDIDRPLLRYGLQLPPRLQPIHFEAGVLLLQAQASAGRLLGASSR